MTAAIPAMLGVVGGSLALLALVWMGAHAVFEVVASLHLVLTVLGAGYVGCLGVMLLWQASGESCAEQRVGLPTTVLGLAGLQFLNPK
ncbi:MAG: LysE family translocator, partial [Pseudomonadota bacterium]